MASSVDHRWMVHQRQLRREREQSTSLESSSESPQPNNADVTAEVVYPSSTPYVDPAKSNKLPTRSTTDAKKTLEVAFNDLKVDEFAAIQKTPAIAEPDPEPVLPQNSHGVSLKDFMRRKEDRRRGITTVGQPPKAATSNFIPRYEDLSSKYEKHNPTCTTGARRFGGRDDGPDERPTRRHRSTSRDDKKKDGNASKNGRDQGRKDESKDTTGFFKRTLSLRSVDSDDDEDSWASADEQAKRFRVTHDPCVIIDDEGRERINYQYVPVRKPHVEVPGHRRRIHQEMDRELDYYFKRGPRAPRVDSRRTEGHQAGYNDGKISVKSDRDEERVDREKDRSRSGLSNRHRNTEHVH